YATTSAPTRTSGSTGTVRSTRAGRRTGRKCPSARRIDHEDHRAFGKRGLKALESRSTSTVPHYVRGGRGPGAAVRSGRDAGRQRLSTCPRLARSPWRGRHGVVGLADPPAHRDERRPLRQCPIAGDRQAAECGRSGRASRPPCRGLHPAIGGGASLARFPRLARAAQPAERAMGDSDQREHADRGSLDRVAGRQAERRGHPRRRRAREAGPRPVPGGVRPSGCRHHQLDRLRRQRLGSPGGATGAFAGRGAALGRLWTGGVAAGRRLSRLRGSARPVGTPRRSRCTRSSGLRGEPLAAAGRNVPRLLYLGPFATMTDRFAVAPLLIPMAASFHVSLVAVSGVASLYYLAYGLMPTLYGVLADRFGRVRVIRVALLGTALADALSALSPNLTALLVARFVTGGIACGVFPTTLVYLADRF